MAVKVSTQRHHVPPPCMAGSAPRSVLMPGGRASLDKESICFDDPAGTKVAPLNDGKHGYIQQNFQV
jgi:hypothetical protein